VAERWSLDNHWGWACRVVSESEILAEPDTAPSWGGRQRQSYGFDKIVQQLDGMREAASRR